MKKRYVAFCGTGVCGTDSVEAFEADSDEQAMSFAEEYAVANAESFGFYVGEYSDDFGEEYSMEHIDYHIEEYDSEKHDMYRCGGGSFEDDF